MSLGALVSLSGVPASTIHHYRRLGLLPGARPAEGGHAGHLCYAPEHLKALQLIREMREVRGMRLAQVQQLLPELLTGNASLPDDQAPGDIRKRLTDAAFRLFSGPNGYTSVTVSEIAAAAGIAKGSVYRYFPSKEALFTAVVESLCEDTAEQFAQNVAALGGPDGLGRDTAKSAIVFGRILARAMPILLELGARAARGDLPSQLLAARVLRTLAQAAGKPLSADPVPAGLDVIQTAFSTVLHWAVDYAWTE